MYEKYEVATISLVTRHPVKELLISEMAINPADNPVGALFERYQTSGAPMPEIEVALITPLFDQTDFPLEKNSLQLLSLIITPQVNMVAGQAHAPVFKAKLSVCEGLVVTATGSSKKIAKNLAAAAEAGKCFP